MGKVYSMSNEGLTLRVGLSPSLTYSRTYSLTFSPNELFISYPRVGNGFWPVCSL